MPYRSHTIAADGTLTLVASDGRTHVIRPADVLALFRLQAGTRAAKLAATRTGLVTGIQGAVGADHAGTITLDVDDATGKVLSFSVVN